MPTLPLHLLVGVVVLAGMASLVSSNATRPGLALQQQSQQWPWKLEECFLLMDISCSSLFVAGPPLYNECSSIHPSVRVAECVSLHVAGQTACLPTRLLVCLLRWLVVTLVIAVVGRRQPTRSAKIERRQEQQDERDQ